MDLVYLVAMVLDFCAKMTCPCCIFIRAGGELKGRLVEGIG